MVVANEHDDGTNGAGAGDGDAQKNPGPSAPLPRQQEVPASACSWPKRASSRPSL
jgi:hypothetical protein